MRKLCWLFPPLQPNIVYSDVLSQRDVNVFAAFVNGHVEQVLKEYPFDEEMKHRMASLFLEGSTGLSRVRERDVVWVAGLLSAASGKDASLKPELRDLVDFLRENKLWWGWLYEAYEKIVKNSLTNTCPMVIAKLPVPMRFIPFAGVMNSYQEYHKLIHESIEYLLEAEGILFDDVELDKGLVVYLHEVMYPSVKYLHYVGDEGRQYLEAAGVFRELLDRYPRSAVVPMLKHLTRSDVVKASSGNDRFK